MDSVTSLSRFFQTEDVLLKEVISIVKEVGSVSNISSILSRVCKGTMKTLVLILLKHYIQDTKMMMDLLKSMVWYLVRLFLYKKRTFDIKSHQTALVGEGSLINGLPVYVEKNTSSVDVIYAKGFHSSYLDQIDFEAQQKHDIENSPNTKYYSVLGQRYSLMKPMSFFPSKNYLKLQNIVETHCKVNDSLSSYSVLGILIDGEPGLGKSKFADFMATRRSFGLPGISNVYRVDMSSGECLKMSPETLFKSFFHDIAIKQSSLFMIDEVDKYLSYYIEDSYIKLKQQPKKEEEENEIVSFEEYSYKLRIDFLYMLLGILERIGNESSCIVIFCSNNFETIFGDLEMTHFHSLNSRFMRVKFERCDRNEIEDYLRYLNQHMQRLDLYEPDIETILSSLDPNINITYRSLNEITVLNSYSIRKIVEELNLYRSPPSSPKTFTCHPSSFSSLPKKRYTCIKNSPPPPSSSSTSSETEKKKTSSEPDKVSLSLEPDKISLSLEPEKIGSTCGLTMCFVLIKGQQHSEELKMKEIFSESRKIFNDINFYKFETLTNNPSPSDHPLPFFKLMTWFPMIFVIPSDMFTEIMCNPKETRDIQNEVCVMNGCSRSNSLEYYYTYIYDTKRPENFGKWLDKEVREFFKL
jgi:hypothetical protein